MSKSQPGGQPKGRAASLAANVGTMAEDAWNRVDLRRRQLLAGLYLRQGARRVRGSLIPILISAVAAFVAYRFSHDVLGHPAPFFAPVAVWICLGFTYNRVPRKVVEIGAGATIGVGIGEVVLSVFGAGGWQLALGLVIASLIARLLDRGDLFTVQAGVNAIVVIGMGTMLSQMTGAGPSRLLDAVVGALTALAFTVLLPGDVLNRPRRYVSNVLTELATTFDMLGEALREGNRERLRDAFAQLRGVQRILSDAETVWKSSANVIALNPTMRKHRPQIDELGRQLELTTRAVHTLEQVVRQSRGVVDELGAEPKVAGLMEDSAATLHALAGTLRHWQPPFRARASAQELAADCAPDRVREDSWRVGALVSLMRLVAIDLLQLTGLSRVQARHFLPDTGTDQDDDDEVAGDEASAVWGSDNLTIQG